ncbi:hypothetical protein FJZ31_20590 [Candidatus Poribacteria bacterium]|nr:hypothetical protein [Candidatus Poribacteria bacterium]
MVMESRTVNEILQTLNEYIAGLPCKLVNSDLRLYQQLSHDEVVHNRHHQSMIRYALQTAIQCVRKAHRRLRLTVIDIGNYILHKTLRRW